MQSLLYHNRQIENGFLASVRSPESLQRWLKGMVKDQCLNCVERLGDSEFYARKSIRGNCCGKYHKTGHRKVSSSGYKHSACCPQFEGAYFWRCPENNCTAAAGTYAALKKHCYNKHKRMVPESEAMNYRCKLPIDSDEVCHVWFSGIRHLLIKPHRSRQLLHLMPL